MNGVRQQALSPISNDGSDWSATSPYQSIPRSDSPYSPQMAANRGQLATPPNSGSSTGMNGGPRNGQGPRPPGRGGNPSPPASIGARSSVGTLSDNQSRRYMMMEEAMAQHYQVLSRYLGPTPRDEAGNPKPNKARDKLLRLSAVQFEELSTDVYDELLRRQAASPPPPGRGPQRPPRPDVPPYLLPRDDFHPKRNQARQKLSSLQQQRFRDLATDVFCELERRFPKFAAGDFDRPPSSASFRGGPPGRGPPPGSRMGPGPGGPGPGGRGFGPPGGPGGRFPPRQGSLAGPLPGGPGGSPDGDYGRPQAKTFQSNTIVPNKSTMVEDDDEQYPFEDDYDNRSDNYGYDVASRRNTSNTSRSASSGGLDKNKLVEYQSQVGLLQEKVDDLEGQLRMKDEQLNKLQDAERDRSSSDDIEKKKWKDLQSHLESKVSDALSLNDNLQFELDRVRADQSSTERDLRSQIEDAKRKGTGDSQWKSKYDQLDREHQSLQIELREQQRVTEEVRREAAGFLKEMKSLSDRHGSNWDREEKLSQDVHRLEKEVQEWKSRYARTKTQLRSMRASSIGLSIQQPDAGRHVKDGVFTQPDGVVKDVHVTKFQISIDEFLRAARSGEPPAVLDQMKAVVIAVRHITQDIDAAPAKGDDLAAQRSKLKSKVSATANNLITAAKNYVQANGLSPVSLLDAAASHLTSAVVELVKTVKIRPTPAGELDDDDDVSLNPASSPGYFSVTKDRISGGDSVYSSMSSPPALRPRSYTKDSEFSVSRNGPTSNGAVMNGGLNGGMSGGVNRGMNGGVNGGTGAPVQMGFGLRVQDNDVEELKVYLEDQTGTLVRSIQSLVGSIRAEDDMTTICSHINAIAVVVGRVVSSTKTTIAQTGNPTLADRADQILQILADCKVKLEKAEMESAKISGHARLREFTNGLPPIAFQIARETKELVQRIDQMDFAEDDDFR